VGPLDRPALRRGLAVALAVVAPAGLISAVVVDPDEGGGASLVFFAVILVGLAAGGAATGRRVEGTPMMHGAVVGLVAYLLVQAGLLVLRPALDRDGDVEPAAIVFTALLSATVGTFGAAIGAARRRTDRRAG
jgi:putative membrane protein (TIGR04086 family)